MLNFFQQRLLFIAATSALFIISSSIQAGTLLDFNEPGASGTTWPGWTWSNSAYSTSTAGFRKDSGRFWSGDSNWLPRIHEKTDYNNSCLAKIDTAERAPSTTSGGSLKVYDDGTAPVKRASYWYLWGDTFGTQGIADDSTDRLSFYFKVTGIPTEIYSNSIDNFDVHFGTYLCWDTCPKETGNSHYYHHLTINPDTWLHVQLDRNPQHRRGNPGNTPIGNNPSAPRNYFQYMNQFYLELMENSTLTAYWVDEMKFWTSSQPENDISISSVWVGYWPNTGKWEIGFNDNSFSGNYNDDSKSTFEIRYSTNPITNVNFNQANLITPEYNQNGSGRIDRPNPWQMPTWTRFSLPSTVVQNNSKIFFAIKDVSSVSNGDGHNSPSSLIRTIDYSLSAGSSSPPPLKIAPPKNLRIITQ